MDKELIAMCDYEWLQDTLGLDGECLMWKNTSDEPPYGRWIRKPSVSWLLREIDVTDGWVEVSKGITGSDVVEYEAKFADYGEECVVFESPPCDSPEKALLHVLLWQHGRMKKDGE